MYHMLSGSLADGLRGRAGNSNPSTSWITSGFKSITVAAGRKVLISASASAAKRDLTASIKEVHDFVNRGILSNNYDMLVGRDSASRQA